MSDMQKNMYTSLETQEDNYGKFLEDIKTHHNSFVGQVLFKTNVHGLFEIFLNALPEHARQHYNCSACHMFVSRYGGVVSINPDYSIEPVMWPSDTAPFFQQAVTAVREYIKKEACITNVFRPKFTVLGIPHSNGYNHMSVNFSGRYDDRRDYIADYDTMWTAINKFSKETIDSAVVFANSGGLFRAKEIILPILRNLKTLKDTLNNTKRQDLKRNIMWDYVSTHGICDCHIRSNMSGTLLEDIQNGLSSDSIVAKYNAKADPTAYMRPQAKPSSGSIKVAEKLFAELGITEESLKRRFATVDDLTTIWKPKVKEEKEEKSGGIFDRLATKDTKSPTVIASVNRGKMTWKKFESDILPHANEISVTLNNNHISPTISTFTAAAFPDAKPILKAEHAVTKYLRNNTKLSDYNIMAKTSYAVTAICYDPDCWGKDVFDKSTVGVNLIMAGAKDLAICKYGLPGTAIFPEDLIPELREVRSVIAEYSNSDFMLGGDEASATGVRIQNGLDYKEYVSLTVYIDMGVITCIIDRFE